MLFRLAMRELIVLIIQKNSIKHKTLDIDRKSPIEIALTYKHAKTIGLLLIVVIITEI